MRLLLSIMIFVLTLTGLPALASEVISTKKMKITIGYCPTGMLETSVAKEKKFYKKYLPNLEVEWHKALYSQHLIYPWLSGKIEVAYMGDMPSIILQNKIRNTRWVSVAVYAHGQAAAILVPHNSTIKTVKDLDGKSVGTAASSSHHRILQVLAKAENIKINMVHMMPNDGFERLRKGGIDAICYWPPFIDLAKYNKVGRVLLDDFVRYEPEVNAIWPLVVSQRFAAEHPEIVRGLVKADNDLHQFMHQQPEAAAAIVYKELEQEFPLPVVKASLARYRYSDKLGPEHIEIMQRDIDFLKSIGIIETGFLASQWANINFTK